MTLFVSTLADVQGEQGAVANTQTVPSALGRGFLSTTGALKSLVCPPDDAELELVLSASVNVSLADDRSTFAKAVSWASHAKLAFWGASGSARAEASRSFQSSRRSVSVILNKRVTGKRFFIRDPKLRPEALSLIEQDRNEFLNRFGDSVITSVTTGGVLSIIYRLDFKYMEEVHEFKSNFNAAYGSNEVSGKFDERIREAASSASLKLTAYSSGGVNAPPILQAAQGASSERETGEISSQSHDQLFAYFDNFEEDVHSSGSVYPIFLERSSAGEAVNAPITMPDISARIEAVEDALALDNEIDSRISGLKYFRDVSHKWHDDQGGREKAKQIIGSLEEKLKLLRDKAERIALLKDDDLTLPISIEDIDRIPPHWILRQLVEHRVNFVSHDPHGNFLYDLNLYDFVVGQPAIVKLVQSFGLGPKKRDHKVSYSIAFVDGSGAELSVVAAQTLNGKEECKNLLIAGSNNGSTYFPFEMKVVIPEGTKSLRYKVWNKALWPFFGVERGSNSKMYLEIRY